MSNNEHTIRTPFYQVKAAGRVVEHTNDLATADKVYRDATKPAEIWLVHGDGTAQLQRRSKFG